MDDDLPRSRNVGRFEAKDFWITAGSWNTGYGESYEIGLRRKHSGAFDLIQANWTEAGVIQAAKAVVLMLDAGFDIAQIKEVLSP